MRTIEITTEDDCWISSRMKAHYRAIMKSKKVSEAQKVLSIQRLAERAHRLGFEELCNWMGYTYLKIDLGDKREAGLFYPTSARKEALEGALHHLEILKELKAEKPSATGS